MSLLMLRIVGGASFSIEDRTFGPSATRLFGLILCLTRHPGKRHSRGFLSNLLFPDAPNEAAATHSLRQLLYLAKRQGVCIRRDSDLLWIEPSSISTDAEEFFRDAAARTPARLEQGVLVLPDYRAEFSEPLAEWVDGYRIELEARIRHQLAADLPVHRARSDWLNVAAAARACLSLDPLNETATLHLAESLAHSGLKASAVQLLDTYAHETGRHASDIALPASVLRRRIQALSSEDVGVMTRLPLLGRAEELATLEHHWSLAKRGSSRIVRVLGGPGAGKSRLVEEFAARASLSGRCAPIIVKGLAMQSAQPFALLSVIVPKLLSMPGAAGCAPTSLPFLRRLESPSSASCGGYVSSEGVASVRLSIERALTDLLDAVSDDQPILLCVDDADSIDDASLTAFSRFLKESSGGCVLILSVGSTDVGSSHNDDVVVGRLAESAMRTIAGAYLTMLDESRRDSAVDWCVEVSGGNPGFLEVLARHCMMHPDDRTVPSGIVAAIARRIASLDSTTRSVLNAICVLQDACTPSVLSAMSQIGVLDLLASLEVLDRAGLVLAEGGTLQPRSRVVLDEVRTRIPLSVLPLLHLRAATTLASGNASRRRMWNISQHWRAAGETALARQALRACWMDAVRVGHLALAQDIIRECLSGDCDTLEVRAELLDALIEVSASAGDSQAHDAAIAKRLALPNEMTSASQRAALSFERTHNRLVNGYDDPTEHVSELRAHLGSHSLDEDRRLRSASLLMIAADSLLDDNLADFALSTVRTIKASSVMGTVLRDRALVIFHATFGSLAMARAAAVRLISLEEELTCDRLRPAIVASLALHMLGDRCRAEATLTTCFHSAISFGAHRVALCASTVRACIAFDYGELDIAESWLSTAETTLGLIGGPAPCDLLSTRTDLALARGDWQSAMRSVSGMGAIGICRTPRFDHALLAYKLRVELASQRACDPADVARLLEWHHRARAYGRHDDEIEVLTRAMSRQGQEEAAAQLLTEYLAHHRRERRPLGHLLQEQARALGIITPTGQTAGREGFASELAQV